MGNLLWPVALIAASALLPQIVFSECNNATHFDCLVGSTRRCIPLEWQCDNVPDCENGRDEHGCNYLHDCAPGTLMCRDGSCISKAFKCDGEADCQDGHDEHSCDGADISHLRPVSRFNQKSSEEAPEHFRTRSTSSFWHVECNHPKYQCKSGHQCIVESAVCDGEEDCPDGDDEKNCTAALPLASPSAITGCGRSLMSCADRSGCIPLHWVCDGESDCDDGSDEADCSHMLDAQGTVSIQTNAVLCAADEFRCEGSIGLCIPMNKTCDGVRDCARGDDEDERCHACHDLGCHHKCHLTDIGGQCYCPDGSKLDSDEKSCLDVDECETHEGKQCQHYCENQHQKYVCRCAAGYSLGRDAHSCHVDKAHEGILLVSLGSEIRSMPIFNPVSEGVYSVAQTIESHGIVRSIDFLHRSNALYMAVSQNLDEGELAVSLDGKLRILRENFVGIGQVAADWIGGNVFITQKYPAAHPGISVCSVNGFYCHRIIDGNLHNEENASERQMYRGLALNPKHGTMAWIESFGGKHRIMSANMDGSNVQMLIDNKLEEPNGLAYDPIRNEIYFGDIAREMIEKVNPKTLERHVVLTHGVHHPFDLAFFDGLLYWSDWGTETLKVAELSWHHASSHVVHSFQRFPYGLGINHTSYQPRPVRDPCDAIKDSCKWICVVVPGVNDKLKPTCVCPDNYRFSAEENTCIPLGRINTDEESFMGVSLMQEMCVHDRACENGGQCSQIEDASGRVVRITCSCPAPFYGERCESVDPSAASLVDEPSSSSWSSIFVLFVLVVFIVIFFLLYKKSSTVNGFTKAAVQRVSHLDSPKISAVVPWVRAQVEHLQTKMPSGTSTRVVHSQLDNPVYNAHSYGSNEETSPTQQSPSAFHNPLYTDAAASTDTFNGYQVSYANKFVQ